MLRMMFILIISCRIIVVGSAPTDKKQLENTVREIADGKHNNELVELWSQMETKAFQGKSKSNRPYQYLIAARLNLAKDNKMTVKPNEIKYYTNIDVQRAKDDCDGVCQAKVNEIRTKQESTDTLERLSGMKTRCNTQVHTELQFLYGKDYRASLSEVGIFLIYSYYIPCAGLA